MLAITDVATCPYCESRSATFVARKIADYETTAYFKTEHALYRCGECDLYYSWPVTAALLDGMRRFFEVYNVVREANESVLTKMVLDTWQHPHWRMQAARCAGQLRQMKWRLTRYRPAWGFGRIEEAMTLLYAQCARTILDVGCAYGGFVKASLLAGFDSYGIEPTRATVDLIRRCGTQRVSHGFFPSDHGPLNRYDAVVFMHSLAYLYPISALLRAARDLLGTGGTLLIFCSDPARFDDPDLASALYSPLTFTHTSERFMRRAAHDLGFSSYRYVPCIGEPICCFHLLTR